MLNYQQSLLFACQAGKLDIIRECIKVSRPLFSYLSFRSVGGGGGVRSVLAKFKQICFPLKAELKSFAI